MTLQRRRGRQTVALGTRHRLGGSSPLGIGAPLRRLRRSRIGLGTPVRCLGCLVVDHGQRRIITRGQGLRSTALAGCLDGAPLGVDAQLRLCERLRLCVGTTGGR